MSGPCSASAEIRRGATGTCPRRPTGAPTRRLAESRSSRVVKHRGVGSSEFHQVGRHVSRCKWRISEAEGSATVELAAAIPLLVVVTMAMISLLGLARDQVLAQGAAREGAREAALGGDHGRARAAARAALPSGRAVRVAVAAAGPDRVRVRVQLPVHLPFGVPLVTVSATAVASLEPGPPPTPAGR
jgi:TadE-like protein